VSSSGVWTGYAMLSGVCANGFSVGCQGVVEDSGLSWFLLVVRGCRGFQGCLVLGSSLVCRVGS